MVMDCAEGNVLERSAGRSDRGLEVPLKHFSEGTEKNDEGLVRVTNF
jgi:hypothetical protein